MRIVRSTLAVVLLLFTALAWAQQYPAKPVRIIVPFPPGQATDILARLLADHLAKSLGQAFVVENKAGAGGAIGTTAAKEPADGYTLVMATSGTFANNPALYPKLPYDPLKDFAPIANVGLTPQVLVTSPKASFNSVKDLVAKAKAQEQTYGSSGNGSTSHLTGELFKLTTGAKLVHVPFKGGPDAQVAVMSGDVAVMFDAIPGVLSQIKSGKLKAVAIASPKRSPFLPDLPTIAEQGYPGFEAVGWIGIAAPAKTPPAILDKLNTEVGRILNTPEVKERLATLAFAQVEDNSREAFAAFIKSEMAKWAKVVKDSGAKVD
jgi:tripartite-type tricarboxylate transporter receptor subunit TctC